VLALMLCITT